MGFYCQTSKQLGIRLSGNCSEPGIYIVDIQDNSTIATDGRLQKFDRLLFVNGQDVRHCRINQASSLIQVRVLAGERRVLNVINVGAFSFLALFVGRCDGDFFPTSKTRLAASLFPSIPWEGGFNGFICRSRSCGGIGRAKLNPLMGFPDFGQRGWGF